jgi:hypothetical protein
MKKMKKNSAINNHSEYAELLPWYANGTLTGDEARKAAEHLSTCLACQSELRAIKSLAIAVKAATDVLPPPPSNLVAEAMKRLNIANATRTIEVVSSDNILSSSATDFKKHSLQHVDKAPNCNTAVEPGSLVTLWRRLWDQYTGLRINSPAFAATQLALIALLAVGLTIVGWSAGEYKSQYEIEKRRADELARNSPNYEAHTGSAQNEKRDVVMINVVFQPNAQEKKIRALLQKIVGNIVHGPTAMGRYTIEVTIKTGLGKQRAGEILKILDGNKGIVRYSELAI